MPRDKHIVTRISLEARNKLAEFSKEKGINNVDIIDYILGTSSKRSLQRLRNLLDQGKLEEYKEYFDKYREHHIKLIKDKGSTAKDTTVRSLNKPPKAVIDSAILCCWSPEEMALIERDIPNPDAEDFRNRTRSDIHNYIRNKMVRRDDEKQECWSNLYRSWFNNNAVYMSPFEKTVDNRILALIREGILKKGTTRGSYQLARTLSKDDWDIIMGVNKLPAQKGLVIPTLLDLK
tara:strand:+ start:314 stop:1015 length:702 start_codon:yes stop_codon:yes gene_type:complete